jgi:methyltransferase family protein
MLAPRKLPGDFAEWNRRWHAPSGRYDFVARRLGRRNPLGMRYRGPFGFQTNNSTRAYEYPWAYNQITTLGNRLRIVELGAGLSGLQFVLAREGHRVTNIDPGLAAVGVGFDLEQQLHRKLCRAFRSPVELISTTIGRAGIPDRSVDVLLSISAIEHFADKDLEELTIEAPRILRSQGVVIWTVDLFLDLYPFCEARSNVYGRNVDLRDLLERASLDVRTGNREELFGFADFDPRRILSRLSKYHLGTGYPALAQCLVATARS